MCATFLTSLSPRVRATPSQHLCPRLVRVERKDEHGAKERGVGEVRLGVVVGGGVPQAPAGRPDALVLELAQNGLHHNLIARVGDARRDGLSHLVRDVKRPDFGVLLLKHLPRELRGNHRLGNRLGPRRVEALALLGLHPVRRKHDVDDRGTMVHSLRALARTNATRSSAPLELDENCRSNKQPCSG